MHIRNALHTFARLDTGNKQLAQSYACETYMRAHNCCGPATGGCRTPAVADTGADTCTDTHAAFCGAMLGAAMHAAVALAATRGSRFAARIGRAERLTSG